MTVRSVVEQMNPSGIDANESVAHQSSGSLNLVHLQRYGLAFLSVGAALGTSLVLQHFGFRVPSALLLLFAVAISSWYAGAGPAVLAAILSTISFYWYFVEPFHTIYIHWSQIPYFVIFTAFAALLSRFGKFRQRAEADLRQRRHLLGGKASFLSPALRLALIYAFFGALWILVSDRLSFFLVPDIQRVERLQTYKGWFFIAVTSLLLWWLATRLISQVRAAAEALHRLNRDLQAISSCNQTLLHATDEQSLLDEICRIICEEAGYRMAWVAYAEHDEAKSVRFAACTGAEQAYLANLGITWGETERSCGPTGTAIRSGKTCCIQDFTTDPGLQPWRDSGLLRDFRSAIALPLKDEHANTFGCLSIYSAQPDAFTPEEVRLLEELAGDMAFGIVTLRSRAARKQAEEALQRSEAYLAETQRLSHTGSWAFHPVTMKTHYWSDETFRIWGFDPQGGPPNQEQLFERIHPEDRATVKAISNKALHEKTGQEYEFRIVLPDGTVKHIHTTVHVVLDGSGDTVEFMGTNVDVTEPKRAGEALRESEANLNRAQEIAHIGSWHLDIARNRLTWSDEVFRIFGVPIGTALTYEVFLDRVHPADRESVHNAWSAALHGAPYDIEHRISVGCDIRWVREQAKLEFSKEGNPTSGIGIVQDITESKRTEEERRQSAERFRAIADYTYDWENWVGVDGKLLWVNPAVERITGYSVDDCMAMPDFPIPIVAEADREAFTRQMREAVQGSTRNDFEFRVRHKDGHLAWVAASWQPIQDSRGARLGYRSSIRDIAERKRAEEALRHSEAYLAEAERLSHTGSWAFDIASDRYVHVSEECLRIFGFDSQEVPPTREVVFRRIHPDDSESVNRGFEKSVHEKVDTSNEFRIVLPDGAVKTVRVTRHPVLNSDGDVVKLTGAAVDITERKRAEEALSRSESYLAEAQRLSHTGSWALDVASGNYVYFSEEYIRISGFDPQQGLPAKDQPVQQIHPDDVDKFWQAYQKLIDEKVDSEGEYRIMLPDGTVKHVHAIRHPVLNAHGELVEVVGTTIDITERKLAEEALHESEKRFRAFVDHAGDALFVQDLEQGTIVDVNRSACDSLGYTREELIGTTPHAFHLDSERAEIESVAQRAAAGETAFDRHWHRRKDGTTFPVEVHTSLVSYGGRRFLLKVARDISDRVRAEEQRDQMRQLEAELAHLDRLTMLGELTASIAHEVNQPLSGIVSNAGACLRFLAGDSPDLDEVREATRDIVRDGKRAGEVIARIRALTKKASIVREKLDLNETLRQVLALVKDEAQRRGVNIRTEFADDLSPVLGDQVQLQQVVLNLAMNAIEAMSSVGERPRQLIISTENLDANQVQVKVEDSGMGLDLNTMQKIFEPFYTTKPTGMGMGLSISRSIVQSHGGRLWATGKEGPGSIFYFTLMKYHEEEPHARVSAA